MYKIFFSNKHKYGVRLLENNMKGSMGRRRVTKY